MNANRKLTFFFILTLIATLFLAACAGGSKGADGDKKDDGKSDGTNNQEVVDAEDGGDLVIATLSDAARLDPHTATDVPSANIQTNLFEGLVKKNQEGDIVQSLALSWEALDDTTWEFQLREGVTFHDGEVFNAEVAKLNIERILDPEVAAPRAFLLDVITNVEATSDYTLKIETEYPFAPLLAHLGHPVAVMVSPKSIEADYAAMETGGVPGATINENPVGTGYFTFDHWTPGVEVKLLKNDNYWGDKVHVDSVTFKVIPESGTRVAELKTGFAHLIEPVAPIEVPVVDGSGNATVDVTNGSSLSYVGFNVEKAPFNDPRVRQAISMLFNQEDVLQGVYDGFGIGAVGPLAPGVFGHNPDMKPLSYDPDRAIELLKEAGYGDGFKTTIWTNDNPQRVDIAVLLQEELKKANIEVQIEEVEWGAYLEKTANGEHDMFILGLSNPVGDADYFIGQLFHSSNKGVSGNRSFYENAEVDRLLDAAKQEIDVEKRQAMYDQIQEILIEEAPMIYVHHQAYLTGVSDKVSGYWIDTSGYYKLQDVRIAK